MSNAYQVVRNFESAMAEFCGSPYAVSVESCSAAIFLCCLYVKVKDIPEITIPKYTYPSVPASIINAGGRVRFIDSDWQKKGFYNLHQTRIIDSAKRLCRNMYSSPNLWCLSFHAKKLLPIGRGGMILTDSEKAVEWFKTMRFDGRRECPLHLEDKINLIGWNMYMTPEQAARGLEFMQWLPDENIAPPDEYTDLSKFKVYLEANR